VASEHLHASSRFAFDCVSWTPEATARTAFANGDRIDARREVAERAAALAGI
jgi:hypothetical protein